MSVQINITKVLKDLETMGQRAILNLQEQVHKAEDEARKELYVARQRFSMLGTHLREDEEKVITDAMDAAKATIKDCVKILEAIKNKIA